MAALVKEHEQVKAGVVTAAELNTVKQGRKTIADALKEYRQNLKNKGRDKEHIARTARHIERAKEGLGWRNLRDMDGDALAGWLAEQTIKPKDSDTTPELLSARTVNTFIVACKAFASWAVRRGMLAKNPFANLERHNEKADRRHVRRVLTDEELAKLFDAAERRPLENFKSRGVEGQTSKIKDSTRDQLLWAGKTHAICWRVLGWNGASPE